MGLGFDQWIFLLCIQDAKDERKAALAAAKDLIVAAESLDFAIRSKDPKEADKLYATLKTKLSAFSSTVVA